MNQPVHTKVSPSRAPRRPSTKQSVLFEYFDPSATVVTLVGFQSVGFEVPAAQARYGSTMEGRGAAGTQHLSI